MAQVTGIGGVFLRAADPKALKAWYMTHLGIDLSSGAWMQQAGPTVFEPMAQDSTYFAADQSVMLNFRVDDLEAMIQQLEGAGIAVMQDPAWNSEIGRFVRIHDPQGTPIELWQPMGPAAE